MGQRRKSVIWLIPKDVLTEIVSTSDTLTTILKILGFNPNKGGNFKTLKKRLIEDKIDYSHIPTGLNANRGKFRGTRSKIPLDQIMVENSSYRHSIKRRLIKEGLLQNICAICRLSPEWNNKPLILVLDHINGVSNDNRLENLRLLCPNCNSQTDTFCGRHRKEVKPIVLYTCGICKKQNMKLKESTHCRNCGKDQPKKFEVSKEELEALVKQKTMLAIGRQFGVSDNAVRKRCRKFGILFRKRDLKND